MIEIFPFKEIDEDLRVYGNDICSLLSSQLPYIKDIMADIYLPIHETSIENEYLNNSSAETTQRLKHKSKPIILSILYYHNRGKRGC